MTVTEIAGRAEGPASDYAGVVRPLRLGTLGVLPQGRLTRRPVLVGRDQDLAVIRAFIDEFQAQGAALLLSGEPGVGKSALLGEAEELAAAAAGARVLRAAGAEFEDTSFSGLNQLLYPLRGELGRLDAPQRDALSVALGFSSGPVTDRLVLASAVLALLSLAAADRPLLLIVDNLHLVDPASARVLGFVARRLAGRRVGLLAAQRSGPPDLGGFGLPGYEVPPLDEDASSRLVTVRFPGLAPRVRQRIVAEAQGNPLALLELPAGLSPLQRSAVAVLPAALPLSRRLRAHLSGRAAGLPAATSYLLLLAVLDETGSLGLLRAAAGQRELSDLAPAERAGLIRVDEATHRVSFPDPLIRSLVLDRSTSDDVRRAHRELARQLSDQPGRRAWHLAGAAVDPDQDVARLLEQAARETHDASRAVTALIRAAELSPRNQDRSRLCAEAACLSATVTGELPLVSHLLAAARWAATGATGGLGPDEALNIAVAEATVALNGSEDIDTVHRLLVRAVGAWPVVPRSSGTALDAALHLLLTVCAAAGRPELWAAFDEARAVLAPDGGAELDLLAKTSADPARSAIGVLNELDAAIGALSGEASPGRILRVAAAAATADRLAGCRAALRQTVTESTGVPSISALVLLAADGFATGAWDEAGQAGEESLNAAQKSGLPAQAWPAREQLALLAAVRGDDEQVAELTGDMLRWAIPRGITLARMAVHRVGALAALGRGDFEEAYREAAAISPPGTLAAYVPHALPAALDLVEAAVRTGRQREAAAHVKAIRAARLAEISPRFALLTGAAEALTATAGQASALFEQALAVPGAARWPFEFARVQLAYGEHLRRARATSDARGYLSAALATFRVLGARRWADRAAGELRATRLTVASTPGYQMTALTPQEHQIAALAAEGLTNKQIGQRLYLSPRTIGAHLYRIFPKLGISSRAGLRDALTHLESGDSTSDGAWPDAAQIVA